MEANSFNVQFTTGASPQKITSAINNVTGWWATNVKGNTNDLDDIFTVRFGKTFSTIKVIEIIPNEKLVWLITDCDLPLFKNPKDWLNTRIVWELNNENGERIVKMTHDGLTPDASCYEDCKKGWTFYVTESLQKLITKGEGLPGAGIFSYIISGDKKYEGLLYFKSDPLPDFSEEFLYIDVKATKGERITAAYAVDNYQKENFNPTLLKGEYFMIVENKSFHDNLPASLDIARALQIE
jgi:hypothetical protein